MARRSGVVTTLARIQREAEKEQRRVAREHDRRQREAIRLQNAEARAQAKYEKDLEKRRRQLYLERREFEVESLKANLEDTIADLQGILGATLDTDDYIDLDSLKQIPKFPTLYIPAEYTQPSSKPSWLKYEPARPQGFSKFSESRK